MNTFYKRRFMRDGENRMAQVSNISPTVITNSSELLMKRRSFLRRHIFDGQRFPVLQLTFYLTGPLYDQIGFKSWLGRADCRIVDHPDKADFVIFTGGNDVDPMLYGERVMPNTHSDAERDTKEIALYKYCRDNGIPMLGVCRGSQFLWVMRGGQLYQDVDNHNNGEHWIRVFDTKQQVLASSVHHQMVKPTNGMKGMRLLATAEVSKCRATPNYTHEGPGTDFEIFAFPDDAILCFQGHPEYDGFPNYSKLCLDLIEEYFYKSKVTTYHGSNLRVAKVIEELRAKILELEIK